MNNARRTELDKIVQAISDLRSQLDSVRDHEQDAYDNMPESFQEGVRGQVSQAALDNIDNALSSLEEAEEALTEAQV